MNMEIQSTAGGDDNTGVHHIVDSDYSSNIVNFDQSEAGFDVVYLEYEVATGLETMQAEEESVFDAADSVNVVQQSVPEYIDVDDAQTSQSLEPAVTQYLQTIPSEASVTITVDEARQSLFKVILYLQSNPPGEDIQIQMLFRILDYINRPPVCVSDDNIKNTPVECHDKKENIHISLVGDVQKRNMPTDILSDKQNENMSSDLVNYDNGYPEVENVDSSVTAEDTRPDQTASKDVDIDTDLVALEISMGCGNFPVKSCEVNNLESDILGSIKVEQICQTDRPITRRQTRGTIKLEQIQQIDRSITRQQEKQENLDVKSHDVKLPESASDKTSHDCSICDKSFSSDVRLMRHVMRHENKLEPYQCVLCKVVCESRLDLSKHMDGHKRHVCKICGLRFKRNATLVKHMNRHLAKKPHTCKYCRQGFDTHEDLMQHIKTHTGVEPYICMLCNVTFRTYSGLNTHMMRHDNDRPYKCDQCENAYTHRSGLKRHLLAHTGAKPYGCVLCEQKFSERSACKRHMKNIHSEAIDRPITRQQEKQDNFDVKSHDVKLPESASDMTSHDCSICDKSFSSDVRLMRHVIGHEKKLEPYQCVVCNVVCESSLHRSKHMDGHKRHVCKICGLRFKRNATLVKHMNRHLAKKPHTCKYCRQGFDTHEDLMQHIKTHTGVEPYICMLCNVTYRTYSGLNTHMMRHDNDRPYKCDQCENAYTHGSGLKLHLLAHKGIKEHMCNVCGKCFRDISTLRVHEVTHTQARKYICSECGMEFIHRGSLDGHMKRHMGVKRFPCTVCERKFVVAGALAQHMLIHTGERNFACDTCGKRFITATQLKCHQVTHTGAKPYGCVLCEQKFSRRTACKRHMKNIHSEADLTPMRAFLNSDN